MAKRFIDTGLFDDEWFSELKLQSKIFWLYFITKCDHAGFLKYNEKLIKYQTGIDDLHRVIKDFPNRIVRVKEHLLFSPKFIQYQYPGFPECNFKAAISAKELMVKNGINLNSYLTVKEELPNSYGNGIGISNGNGIIEKECEILNFHEGYKEVWDIWVKYKKEEFNDRYKTKNSEQVAINNLVKISNSDPATALQIVNNSISSRYKGLFPIKNDTNTTSNQQLSKRDREQQIFEQLGSSLIGG